MGVDWGFAGQVGGIGFGMVFALLIVLALVVWLTGVVVNRIGGGKDKADNAKEGT